MDAITDTLWTVPAPLTFAGLKLNTRMTLCRLSDGGLVVISPTPATAETRAAGGAIASAESRGGGRTKQSGGEGVR